MLWHVAKSVSVVIGTCWPIHLIFLKTVSLVTTHVPTSILVVIPICILLKNNTLVLFSDFYCSNGFGSFIFIFTCFCWISVKRSSKLSLSSGGLSGADNNSLVKRSNAIEDRACREDGDFWREDLLLWKKQYFVYFLGFIYD